MTDKTYFHIKTITPALLKRLLELRPDKADLSSFKLDDGQWSQIRKELKGQDRINWFALKSDAEKVLALAENLEQQHRLIPLNKHDQQLITALINQVFCKF